jgi:hypothetical protein
VSVSDLGSEELWARPPTGEEEIANTLVQQVGLPQYISVIHEQYMLPG